MNTPAKTLAVNKGAFRGWLQTNSFAKSGDTLERQYHSLLDADFPRNEQFWRHFVVPLTNRIAGDKTDSYIRSRDGVDPILQYICGANYSCFVHFALAKVFLENWNDTSLDAVYTRLASAFDVFEALIIKFHLLMCECRGVKPNLYTGLSLEEFLKLASDYYQSEYPKLHQYYFAVGKKVPPIKIPTVPSLLGVLFGEHPKRGEYLTISNEVRSFRNAIVHDVRIGTLKNEAGEILVPRPSRVSNYRIWSKVQEAAKNPTLIAEDFREVKAQCSSDIQRSVEVVNALYEPVLNQLNEEVYTDDRTRLRALFGIRFLDDSPVLPAVVRQLDGQSSTSFYTHEESTPITKCESGVFPVPRKWQD